jgi:hypothetical protein
MPKAACRVATDRRQGRKYEPAFFTFVEVNRQQVSPVEKLGALPRKETKMFNVEVKNRRRGRKHGRK